MILKFEKERVTYQEFKNLAANYYKASVLSSSQKVIFSLVKVKWMDLFPAMNLLIWSSRLRNLDKSVTWVLPRTTDEAIKIRDELNFRLSHEVFDRLEGRVRWFMKTIYSTPKLRKQTFEKIRTEYLTKYPTFRNILTKYFEIVQQEMSSLRFVAFLERWNFLRWGEHMGVQFDSDWRSIPFHRYLRSSQPAGSLPVKCIASYEEVSDFVNSLSDPKELAEVFREYSNLNMFTSGAFAKIIIKEISTNICEHAISSDEGDNEADKKSEVGRYGFVATQVLKSFDLAKRGTEKIAPEFFQDLRGKNVELLEIIIADDGPGMCSKLAPWMRSEDPEGKRFKYLKTKNSRFFEREVLNHAFDRLVSSKRDFRHLIHCFPHKNKKEDRISSGLYWVWHTVKSYQGLLLLRSDHTTLWYDLRHSNGEINGHFDAPSPMCGVQLAIYLPFSKAKESTRYSFPVQLRRFLPNPPKIEISWFGHIKQNSISLSDEDINKIIEDLKTKYLSMKEKGVFAVDLSGIHAQWVNKDLISILAHFFVELNYRYGPRSSAVVLWNVPSKWEKDLIRPSLSEEINKVIDEFPHLVSLRPFSLLIWDDGTFEITPKDIPSDSKILIRKISVDAKIVEYLLECLENQPEMEIDDLWESLPREIRGECQEILKEEDKGERGEYTAEPSSEEVIKRILHSLIDRNSHLICRKGKNCSLHILKEDIETEAQKHVEDDVKKCIKSIVGSSSKEEIIGVLRNGEQTQTWYHLPSGAYTQKFYQFSVMLSDSQWLARIGWWFSKIICDHYQDKIDNESDFKMPERFYLMTVTRSTIPILKEIKTYLDKSKVFRSNNTKVEELSELTVNKMEEKLGQIEIPAGKKIENVVITDVLSQGNLMSRLWEACKTNIKLEPEIVIALLDTRDGGGKEKCKVPEEKIYSMHEQKIVKYFDFQNIPKAEKIVEIDKINVCPVDPDSGELEYPEEIAKNGRERGKEFFNSLSLRDEKTDQPICGIGHFKAGNYHHYTFYLDLLKLVNEYRPKDGSTCLLERLCSNIVRDFDGLCGFSNGERPVEDIIAIYPDPQVSKAEPIVRKLQSKLGFTRSLILYRDREVGTWIFTPFIEHGINMKGKYLLLVDDGCCSGQTLMSMIECALHNRAKKVVGYFFINRMSILSTQYFKHSYSRKKKVTVKFLVPFHIPIFDPQACPFCRYEADIDFVVREYPILSLVEFCNKIKKQIHPIDVVKGENKDIPNEKLPWPQPGISSTTHLRQAFELSSLISSERKFLSEQIENIRKWAKDTKESLFPDKDLIELLSQIAYIIVTEPETLENRVLGARESTKILIDSMFVLLRGDKIVNKIRYLFLETIVNILEYMAGKKQISTFDDYANLLWRMALTTKDGVLLLSFLIARGSLKSAYEIHSHSRKMYIVLLKKGLQRFRTHIKNIGEEFSPQNLDLILMKGLLLFSPIELQLSIKSDEDPQIFYQNFIKLYKSFWGHRKIKVRQAYNGILKNIQGLRPNCIALRGHIDYIVQALTGTEALGFLQVISKRYKDLIAQYQITDDILRRISDVEMALRVFYCFAFGGNTLKDLDICEHSKRFKEQWPKVFKDLRDIIKYYFSDISNTLKKYNQERLSYLPSELSGYGIEVYSIPEIREKKKINVFAPEDFVDTFMRETFDNLKYAFEGRKGKSNKVKVSFDEINDSKIVVRIEDNGKGVEKEREERRYSIIQELGELIKEFGGEVRGPINLDTGGCEIALFLRKCEERKE